MKKIFNPSILALATTVTSTDGIGAYSAEFLLSITRILPAAGCTVVALEVGDDQVFPAHWELRTAKGRTGYGIRVMVAALRQRPDEIIVFHVGLLPLAWIVARLCGAKLTIIAYGWDVSVHLNRMRRILATRVDRAAAISRHTALALDKFFQPGLPRKTSEVFLLPPTFDDDRYVRDTVAGRSFRERYGFADDDVLLLTVARLESSERGKGHDRVIRALPHLLVATPSIKYVVVGKGDDAPRLQALVDRLGLGDVVRFLGRVDDPSEAYSACDLFVMPSTQEGFGIVFIEALACGLPVVAGAMDGSASALLWGELGFLCDPYDESSVARAISLAIESSHSTEGRSDPAFLRARVVDAFGREAFDQRLSQFLITQGYENASATRPIAQRPE